jgi:hypothetical protein
MVIIQVGHVFIMSYFIYIFSYPIFFINELNLFGIELINIYYRSIFDFCIYIYTHKI